MEGAGGNKGYANFRILGKCKSYYCSAKIQTVDKLLLKIVFLKAVRKNENSLIPNFLLYF